MATRSLPSTKIAKGAIRMQIVQAFERDQPKFTEMELWFEAKAEIFGVDEEMVRDVIAHHSELFDLQVRIKGASQAQKCAVYMGATKRAAIATLNKALEATTVKALLDKKGIPVMDEDTGKPVTFEIPDHPSRIAAAREILKIHGGYAPQKIDVANTTDDPYAGLTDEELDAAIRDRGKGLAVARTSNRSSAA